MASSLSKVSGGGGAGGSASAVPPDSYEEQLQKQKQHLTSRQCYQVSINVSGARNIPSISRGTGFYVTLEGMSTNCGGFKLETPTVEKAEDLKWPGDYRMLHFEAAATEGFYLELTCTRSMGRGQSLGRVPILFQYLLQQPELSVEAWLPLEPQKKSDSNSRPELLVKACIQAAVPSPFLLRAVQGDFRKKSVPEGRWSTRSMVDHNSEEKYLVRVRRAKPKKRYHKEWNAPVEEWEKEVWRISTKGSSRLVRQKEIERASRFSCWMGSTTNWYTLV